ncbi:hypothetical protein NMY22_g3767 [Coprinellus aureogranulatus]|nr:hypothetical protein NMY22_g3767 [Coprinellus aureogranulatus]
MDIEHKPIPESVPVTPASELASWLMGNFIIERRTDSDIVDTAFGVKAVLFLGRQAALSGRFILFDPDGPGRWKGREWLTYDKDEPGPIEFFLKNANLEDVGFAGIDGDAIREEGDHIRQVEADSTMNLTISWRTLCFRVGPMPTGAKYDAMCDILCQLKTLYVEDPDFLINFLGRAIPSTPESHPNYPRRLFSLGQAFWARYAHKGRLQDLDGAILSYQNALSRTPPDYALAPDWNCKFAEALLTRYELKDQLEDLTLALSVFTKASRLIREEPSGEVNRWLSLAYLEMRVMRVTDTTPATSWVGVLFREPDDCKGDGDTDIHLIKLLRAFARATSFHKSGDQQDLDAFIAAMRPALKSAPPNINYLPLLHESLGLSLIYRFEQLGDADDLDEGISVLRKAMDPCPKEHSCFFSSLFYLAEGLLHRSRRSGSSEDMKECISLFKYAATSDLNHDPELKLSAAGIWASLSAEHLHDPRSPEVIAAIDTAVHSMGPAGIVEQTLSKQYSKLQRSPTFFVRFYASIACKLGLPDRAVEWLELGRCLVWRQLGDLRTSVDELLKHDRTLAEEIIGITGELEGLAAQKEVPKTSFDANQHYSAVLTSFSHSQLTDAWGYLQRRVRDTPGFEDFLLPKPCTALLQHLPASGPVVIINMGHLQCDAIALSAELDGPLLIPLPNFSVAVADKYRKELHDSLVRHGLSARTTGLAGPGKEMGARILQGIWKRVVKPIIDALGFSRSHSPSTAGLPRIWWCPTGPLSFLPLHAAGIYKESGCESLLDYAISSYTPTVNSLVSQVTQTTPIDNAVAGLFLTSHPDAISGQPIPGAAREVNSVYASARRNGVRVMKREGIAISVDECLQSMEDYSSVHLSCHALQDSVSSLPSPPTKVVIMGLPVKLKPRVNMAKPLRSRFYLHNGSLDLHSIIQKKLKNADLAFLSACQTSMGEDTVSDENAHLAAGMLVAGYRRVVATMWAIGDGTAEQITNDFYQYLWDQRPLGTVGGFDGSQSAYALHSAVQKMRLRLDNSDTSLLKWVPYVHWGY